jgi:hypothetical protein
MIGAVHEDGLDAIFRHLVGDDPAAGAEQGLGGHNPVTRFQRGHDG